MSALERIFDWGLETGWQVALLIAAVLLALRLFGRWLSPRGRYALWLLVALRLALPALPELPVGLVDWSREPAASAPLHAPVPSPARTAPRERAAAEPRPQATPQERDARRPSPPLELAALPAAPPDERAWSWPAAGAAVWLAGALALLARAALCELRFRRRLRAAERVEDAGARAALERARRAMGLRREIELLRFDELPAPAVHGWLRPRVLLSERALARLDAADLERVLRHELAHVRRHDVALNALVCALRALWWPHPLVHLAIARLRAAQEALRDWEAVSREGSPAPLAYARTLLALATPEATPAPPGAIAFARRGRDLQQRILMMTDYRRPGLAAGALATVLFTGLGLASLTSARAVPSPVDGQAQTLRRIQVERHRVAPEWRAALERALQRSSSFDCQDCTLSDVLEYLRQVGGLNLVVHPDVWLDQGDLELSFRLTEAPLAEVLDAICESTEDLDWALVREAVYVGPRYGIREAQELRFYKIAPLLEATPEDEREGLGWELLDHVQQLAGGYDAWEEDGVWIELWDDVLVVNHTESVHDKVQTVLDLFLNRGSQTAGVAPDWERALREQLARTVSVDLVDVDLAEALGQIEAELGLQVALEEDFDGYPVTLRLQDVSLGTALDWIASLNELYVDLRRTGVVLSRYSPKVLRFYEVGDLFGPTWEPRDEELRARVDDTIRATVDPGSWDEDPRSSLGFWGELMVVVQSEEAHAQIAALLDAVRRATSE